HELGRDGADRQQRGERREEIAEVRQRQPHEPDDDQQAGDCSGDAGLGAPWGVHHVWETSVTPLCRRRRLSESTARLARPPGRPPDRWTERRRVMKRSRTPGGPGRGRPCEQKRILPWTEKQEMGSTFASSDAARRKGGSAAAEIHARTPPSLRNYLGGLGGTIDRNI